MHFTTIARWRVQKWKVETADHPLEIARGRIEAVPPLVTGNPETTIQDLIDGQARNDFYELTDGEVLRRTAREVAIATTLVARRENQYPVAILLFLSTFFTSIWTAVLGLSVGVLRATLSLQRAALWFFDVDAHPIQSIGIMAGALVLAVGFIWSALKALFVGA